MDHVPVVIDVSSEDKKPLSIPEVAQMLQNEEIDPGSLHPDILKQCAMHFKLKGFPDDFIGTIIHKSGRVVRRYVSSVRSMNALSTLKQADHVYELVNSFKERKLRVSKIAYSDNVKPSEALKAIQLLQEIDMNAFYVLETAGFIKADAAELLLEPKFDKEFQDLVLQMNPYHRTDCVRSYAQRLKDAEKVGIKGLKHLLTEIKDEIRRLIERERSDKILREKKEREDKRINDLRVASEEEYLKTGRKVLPLP